jgi:dihydroxyacetone kinase
MEVIPLRVYSGLLMTALDSSGVHVSILKLPENDKNLILNFLDEKTEAPGWPGCSYSISASGRERIISQEKQLHQRQVGPSLNIEQAKLLKICLEQASHKIIENEKSINDLDRGCGDGDCGSTLKQLGEGINILY